MNSKQKTILAARQAKFNHFVAESFYVLSDFFSHLGVSNPNHVIDATEDYIPYLDSFLKVQNLESFSQPDRTYLLTVLTYFSGQLFISRWKGIWKINKDNHSIYFARYVIGDFPGKQTNVVIDPASIANACLIDRKLSVHIEVAKKELLSYA